VPAFAVRSGLRNKYPKKIRRIEPHIRSSRTKVPDKVSTIALTADKVRPMPDAIWRQFFIPHSLCRDQAAALNKPLKTLIKA
jgi:hypothetical protein